MKKPLKILHKDTGTEEQTVDIIFYKDLNAVVASIGNSRVGALRVKPYEGKYQVDSVSVKSDYRKLGIGKEMYRVAFETLHSLYSDLYQTPNAKRIWKSLMRTGEAKRIGNRYKMV